MSTHDFLLLVRVAGIEPASHPWEGYILPLNYTRQSRSGGAFLLCQVFVISESVGESGSIDNFSRFFGTEAKEL